MLLACTVISALPLLSSAGEASPPETVIRLSVRPMAAPRPALKYQLLPDLGELNPGNPIPAYLKCFMEQQHFFFNKQAQDDREKYQTLPLADLPAATLRNYGGSALKQADWAARLDTADWQTLLKLRADGYGLLIPEVQQLRMLAAALKVRFRAEVAECGFDDAVRTAKTMFAMARHLGQHPTLVGDLVGIAVANIAITTLDEMLQQPGCPNLYWALTDLPRPLIDLRLGCQGEWVGTLSEFAVLDSSRPMSPEELNKALEHFGRLFGFSQAGKVPDRLMNYLDSRVKDEADVRAARQRLVESGLPDDRVQLFPAAQVILLDEKREFEIRRDGVFKGMALPHWQMEALAAAAGPAKRKGLFDDLLPAVIKVRRAQSRLEQRIALLRHVEAIRLYAAAHDGKLPSQLSDVEVPLPVDPFTGKPFGYKVEGQTAFIQGSPPSGEKNPVFKVRYEVTLKK
jgi:hypothetical protein